MRNIKNTKGITLIALVITIIVLLILAGITIASLTGENGLLKRASQASEKTKEASIQETLQVTVLGSINEDSIYTSERAANKLIEIGATAKANTSANTIKGVYNGYKYTVDKDGIVHLGGGDYSADVKEKLVADKNGTTTQTKSPYIMYNGILCRVLYGTNSPYGIEIISDDVMKTGDEKVIVKLGYKDTKVTKDDFDTTGITRASSIHDSYKQAAASYNRALTTLNEKAEDYLDGDGIAEYARCVGSDPLNQEDITETAYAVEDDAINAYVKTYGYNNKFKVADEKYKTDYDQMRDLGIVSTPSRSSYVLASRYITPGSVLTEFGVSVFYEPACFVSSSARIIRLQDDSLSGQDYSGFIRPVFHLSSTVKIKEQEGHDGSTPEKALELMK